MRSCYVCRNQAKEICSKCGQPFCVDHKALKIGSLCLQCGVKETNKENRSVLIGFSIFVGVSIIAIISLLASLL